MAMHARFSVSSFGVLLVFPIDLYFCFHFLFSLWALSGRPILFVAECRAEDEKVENPCWKFYQTYSLEWKS